MARRSGASEFWIGAAPKQLHRKIVTATSTPVREDTAGVQAQGELRRRTLVGETHVGGRCDLGSPLRMIRQLVEEGAQRPADQRCNRGDRPIATAEDDSGYVGMAIPGIERGPYQTRAEVSRGVHCVSCLGPEAIPDGEDQGAHEPGDVKLVHWRVAAADCRDACEQKHGTHNLLEECIRVADPVKWCCAIEICQCVTALEHYIVDRNYKSAQDGTDELGNDV
mmetsp:Transcript_47423/g.119503  ORF Transcript_47423/g.119503 Transcript_47423/m.119503 type:complete len:223 (+) Transcript_47423:152-820(+)